MIGISYPNVMFKGPGPLFVYNAASTYCDLKGKKVQKGEPTMFASKAKLNMLFLRLSLGFSFCLLVFERMSTVTYEHMLEHMLEHIFALFFHFLVQQFLPLKPIYLGR